jgi:hypothetical protein
MKKIFVLFFALLLSTQALTLPKSVYKTPTITPESSYPVFELMRDAKKFYHKGDFNQSTQLFIRALLQAKKGSNEKNIDQYDYLYANHGILTSIEHKEKEDKTYIKLAKNLLRYLDKATKRGIWEEGELGQLQLMIYRHHGNTLAKKLYAQSKRKDKKLMQAALYYIKKAEKYIRSEQDFYIKDTKAKISNALKGNPPLKDEKAKIKVTKIIKKPKTEKKVPQKQ